MGALHLVDHSSPTHSRLAIAVLFFIFVNFRLKLIEVQEGLLDLNIFLV